jgi:hypothetical protein
MVLDLVSVFDYLTLGVLSKARLCHKEDVLPDETARQVQILHVLIMIDNAPAFAPPLLPDTIQTAYVLSGP